MENEKNRPRGRALDDEANRPHGRGVLRPHIGGDDDMDQQRAIDKLNQKRDKGGLGAAAAKAIWGRKK